ncbi:type II toxin-antitoxin system VapC family toxin [Candidatus Harpocratesius sp.]
MKILIDTNFFYALTDIDDSRHDRALEILQTTNWDQFSLILTNVLVINETYTLLMYRSQGNTHLFKELDELFWGKKKFFQIIYPTQHDYQQICETIQKFSSSKRQLSFVDASLIYLGKKLTAQYILSFDSHFDGILIRIS